MLMKEWIESNDINRIKDLLRAVRNANTQSAHMRSRRGGGSVAGVWGEGGCDLSSLRRQPDLERNLSLPFSKGRETSDGGSLLVEAVRLRGCDRVPTPRGRLSTSKRWPPLKVRVVRARRD